MAETVSETAGVRAWLKDSGSLTGYQLVATAVGTVTFLLIARSLGADDFGAFAAVFGVAQATSIFLDAGMGTFLLRDLSQAGFTEGVGAMNLVATALWVSGCE